MQMELFGFWLWRSPLAVPLLWVLVCDWGRHVGGVGVWRFSAYAYARLGGFRIVIVALEFGYWYWPFKAPFFIGIGIGMFCVCVCLLSDATVSV